MSGGDAPRDADFEQTSSQLHEGLKSCRAVVNDYRAILAGKAESGDNDNEAATDTSRYVSTTDSVSENDPEGCDESAS